jgi:hypothetical protein
MSTTRTASRATLALALASLLAGAAAPALGSELARADEAWARRAEGASGGRAPGPAVEALVAAHERALAADPASLEARWKLLRALHFQGDFATPDSERRKAVFERATKLADESLAVLYERTGPLAGLSDAKLRQRLADAGVAKGDAAGVEFWSAVAWGSWSRDRGLLDAVREGVASRVHDHALLAHRIDPDVEEGGPLRLLARLHGTLPRVPWVSGWVDRDQAVPLAEEAAARWPGHPGNRFLVALTWLDLAPRRRPDALAALRAVAGSEPRAAKQVEDAAVVQAAAERLAREGEGAG